MANEEHLAQIKKGSVIWYAWRLRNFYHRPLCRSRGFEGLPLDFDDAAFYRRFDRFSKSGHQMREEGCDHGAMLRG